MMSSKAETQAQLVKQIDALEQEIIRLNGLACQRDYEQGGLTPYEFVQLPEVVAKEEAMKRLNNLCEILHKFFPMEMPPREVEEEELLY